MSGVLTVIKVVLLIGVLVVVGAYIVARLESVRLTKEDDDGQG